MNASLSGVLSKTYIRLGIYSIFIYIDLKMKVRTRGVAGGADLAYILTLRYGLTRADAYAAEGRLSCPHAIAVVYKHVVAPA